jgi:hypothetical protein
METPGWRIGFEKNRDKSGSSHSGCGGAGDELGCNMQNLSALTTITVNLKLNGEKLAKVHFEHIPRVDEVIKFENDGKKYKVKMVEYNVQQNSGGDVTCESIDVCLAAA